MKIILITGMSGSGKTSICKKLCEDYPEKYNFVSSYTDREMREKNEWGHTFVDTYYMDILLGHNDIVAQTKINETRYCTLLNQFDKNKVNLYTVDFYGINDTIQAFPQADIMIVLIKRSEIDVDDVREGRDVAIPAREDVDFIIHNDGIIDIPSAVINTLVNFDFFTKPSRIIKTISDKLKYIDEQHRRLDDIRRSLYEQLWYINQPAYNNLCKYVQERVNNDFDFEVTIKPDTQPEIYDGCLNFNVIGEYTDGEIDWATGNNLLEKINYYARSYCDDHGYDDLQYRLTVAEQYIHKGEY